jgi:hypothetical protein
MGCGGFWAHPPRAMKQAASRTVQAVLMSISPSGDDPGSKPNTLTIPRGKCKTVLNAQCSMLNAQCSMPNAGRNVQYSMFNAQCWKKCSILNVQCSMLEEMFNTQCSSWDICSGTSSAHRGISVGH